MFPELKWQTEILPSSIHLAKKMPSGDIKIKIHPYSKVNSVSL